MVLDLPSIHNQAPPDSLLTLAPVLEYAGLYARSRVCFDDMSEI